MNTDEIIEMAKQAGIRFRRNVFYSEYCDGVHGDELEAFAKLVAQHERNEIIEILDASTGYVHMDAIRERGQK